MDLFVVDTTPSELVEAPKPKFNRAKGKFKAASSHVEAKSQKVEDEDFLDFDVSKFLPNENDKKPSAVEQSVNNFCKSMGWNKDGTKNKRSLLSRDDEYDSDMEKELKKKLQSDIDKSVTKNLIKKKAIPNYGPEHLAKIKKLEREKTKGSDWYGLPATEVTEEIGNDLKLLQMRSVLDPKRFYKKNDLKVIPKYFQIGQVMHSPLDYYNERDVRKNKKSSLVEELMKDAQFQRYNKKKYKEVMHNKRTLNGFKKAVMKVQKYRKLKKIKN